MFGTQKITKRTRKISMLGHKNYYPNYTCMETKPFLTSGAETAKSPLKSPKPYQTAEVIGIDSSPNMINLAQTLFPQTDSPNFSFQLADAKNFAFPPIFDRIFSNAVLHWIPNQFAVLSCVEKCLKHSDRLLFQWQAKAMHKKSWIF